MASFLASASRRRTLLRLALIVGALVVVFFAWFLVRLGQLRAMRATGPSWSFPSRIFSDGVALSPGRILPGPYLESELLARDYRRVPAVAEVPGTYARIPDGFAIVLRGLPDEPDPAGSSGPEVVRVHLAGGRLTAVERLGGVPGSPAFDAAKTPRLEPVLVSMVFDQDRVWRTYVSLERVPEPVRNAIVASEDRRFYGHAGVDVRASVRALFANMRSGGVVQGGSTITQQLARGLFLGRRRTLTRKLAEIPLAMALEVALSKQQILEMYLNSTYWGQAPGFGVGGVTEAARWYFDVPVESLTVVQGATLAGMVPAPNEIDPFRNPRLTLERRNRVLRDMVETRRLTAAAADSLSRLPLGVRRGPLPVERFPSYTDYVRDLIDRRFSAHAATHFGLSIYATMDLAWQLQAEAGLAAGLAALDGPRGRLQGACVVLEPSTSSVLAMVGGRRPRTGDFNRATQAKRQTGSAIKPIVYAAAFASGANFTPATTVPDTTRTIGRGRDAWTPHNFDGSTHAEVTLAAALERSLNIATTNLVERVGPNEIARVAGSFGLGRFKPVLSIGLGSNEASLLDLTNAFAVFGQRGMSRIPSPLRVALDRSGRVLLEPDPRATQVIPEGIAALMTGLLENVVRYGVAAPLRSSFGFERPVAGKTGTTDDFRDAWFVGFTPDLVAGVWVGFDRPRPIGQQASRTALPIWARIVGGLIAGFPPTPFAIERDLEWRDIDPWSGFLADSTCERETVPFLPGTAPVSYCEFGPHYFYGASDSLGAEDTTWHEEPDTLGIEEEPDTLGEEPPTEPGHP